MLRKDELYKKVKQFSRAYARSMRRVLKFMAPCAAVLLVAVITGCKLFNTRAGKAEEVNLKVIPEPVVSSGVLESSVSGEHRTESKKEQNIPEVSTEAAEDAPVDPYYRIPDKLTLRRKVIPGLSAIYQDDLLTGCEATGLTEALNWYGYDVDKYTIADEFLPKSELRWEDYEDGFWDDKNTDFWEYWDGGVVGPDFKTTFIGDPYREETSYGCYAPCVVRTANKYFKSVGSTYKARDISGTELNDLFRYIEAGIPVILIVTPFLEEPESGDYWFAEDIGEVVHWQKGHHCMVLIGFDLDDNCVYTADPANGCVMVYDMDSFKYIYDIKGQSALYIDTGAVKIPEKVYTVGDRIHYAGRAYTDSKGTEEADYAYNDWSGFVIDKIDPDERKPYRVHLEDFGWVGIEAVSENLPYYGDGSDNTLDPEFEKEYALRNVHSAYYLNAQGSDFKQLSSEESDIQKFKLSSAGDDKSAVKISFGKGKYLTAEPGRKANAVLSSSDDPEHQEWVLQRVSEKDNKFVIALKSDPSLVLSVRDDEEKTDDTSNVYVTKYRSSPEQMWCFEKVK